MKMVYFKDVTDVAGVGGASDKWGTSCGFFDYDNDGLLGSVRLQLCELGIKMLT